MNNKTNKYNGSNCNSMSNSKTDMGFIVLPTSDVLDIEMKGFFDNKDTQLKTYKTNNNQYNYSKNMLY